MLFVYGLVSSATIFTEVSLTKKWKNRSANRSRIVQGNYLFSVMGHFEILRCQFENVSAWDKLLHSGGQKRRAKNKNRPTTTTTTKKQHTKAPKAKKKRTEKSLCTGSTCITCRETLSRSVDRVFPQEPGTTLTHVVHDTRGSDKPLMGSDWRVAADGRISHTHSHSHTRS